MLRCKDTRVGYCVPRKTRTKQTKKPSSNTAEKKSRRKAEDDQLFTTKRILNPAFSRLNIDNPIFQHVLHDKITDFERSVKITVGVSIATSPFLTKLRFSSPQGFIASSLIVGVISAPILSYANSADQYADLIKFASTREIYGHKLVGDTHVL